MGFTLRPYQADLIARACAALKERQAPLVVLPTGGGKTALIAEIVRLNRSTGRQTVVICHRREILQQIAAAITRHTGEAPQLAEAGSRPDWSAPVLVAMVHTIVRRLDQLPQGVLLIADEAHHMGSPSWRKVRDAMAPELLIGFTATPIRPDGRGLGEAGFDVLLEGPSPRWLMAQGHLCMYDLYAAAQIDVAGVRTTRGDYDISELGLRVVGLAGSVVRDWLRLNTSRMPTICVGVSVEHAEELAAAFRAAGIKAVAVDGKTPTAERDRIFAAFRAGEIQVLCCCALVDEGLDVPEAGCLQLVRPTRSLRLLRQLQGRVLRPSPGKVRALLIDHGPSWRELPPPCEEIAWSLDASTVAQPRGERSKTIRASDGRIEVVARQDPSAQLVHITPEQAALQREEHNRKRLETVCRLYGLGRIPKGAIYTELRRCLRTMGEFKAAAKALGHSNLWAMGQFQQQKKEREAAERKAQQRAERQRAREMGDDSLLAS
ncbi:DEAD/DEAH box helicase [Cyanobium gracile]|uniref:DEAD/DEAH box helicase n=1 Tax=Cyanobium gracile UHCC 0281 TaxID=3110309 RepID=A0ABU5SZ79_9CYAN|nr:DEAD/DEAH box helicase [Cyanobium gracile]MEA5443337.1 DEAD/DEAH box helicase [Cyanobium gracile UHCC 0281]